MGRAKVQPMESLPRWLYDLIAYFIGTVIVVIILAWLRAVWREREQPTSGQSTAGDGDRQAGHRESLP